MTLKRLGVVSAVIASLGFFTTTAEGVDWEAFEFNDANSTELFQATNSANLGNNWFSTNDGVDILPSEVRNGSFIVLKDTSAFASNYLQTDNVSSGKAYLVAEMSGWAFRDFDAGELEQIRFGFITEDTGNSGNTVAAQMQVGRDTSGGVELNGSAIGPGSSNIANRADLNIDQSAPFTAVLELDKDSNTYKVFYRNGSDPSQVLGSGTVSPGRDGNSVRFVINNNFGSDIDTTMEEFFGINRFAVSDTNPLTDLTTADIDRTTGVLTLRNTTGAALTGLQSVSITSAAGGLDAGGWKPITGNYDAAGDRSVDSDDNWMVDVSLNSELSESVAGVGDGGSLAEDQSVVLSQPEGTWLQSIYEDLQVELGFTGGLTRTANVNFVGNNGQRFAVADLNYDGQITTADWPIFVAGSEVDLSGFSLAEAYQRGDLDGDGVNSVFDFGIFKSAYDSANGSGAFARDILGVPEPSAVILVSAAFFLAFTRWRMWRHSGAISLLVLAAACGTCPTARAMVFEDFPFNDPNGTLLAGAANTANPGNMWFEDPDMTESFVQNGSYLVEKANFAFGSNGLDIADITSGTQWLVADFGGWNIAGNAIGGDEEQIRFTFLNNETADPPGSTITAQVEIERIDTDGGTTPGRLEINGSALGTGGTGISAATLSLSQEDPFTVVLELDKDANTYSVFYRDGADPFVQLGSGNVDPARNGNTVRMVMNNNFGDTAGEFVEIDRLYLTDEDPISSEIDLLTLQVNAASGATTLANSTTTSFDIDYYRIQSDSGSLNKSGWESLDAQGYDAGGPGIGESWDEAAGSDNGVLAELYLLGSSVFEPTESVDLGSAFTRGGTQDLIFQYRDAASGNVFTGEVEYVAGPLGDFNNDGLYDCVDVDALVAEIVDGSNDLTFDLTGDGNVDGQDLTQWLANAGSVNLDSGNAYLRGDANLDGLVDVSDFNFWNGSKFTNTPAWCSGDFNASGFVDVSDFNLWNGNKFLSADASTGTVPESATAMWRVLALWLAAGGWWRRQRSAHSTS